MIQRRYLYEAICEACKLDATKIVSAMWSMRDGMVFPSLIDLTLQEEKVSLSISNRLRGQDVRKNAGDTKSNATTTTGIPSSIACDDYWFALSLC
mmetsp:Transcript_17114/g.26178  ORF Transcript_17114/g.26178 Transcript_17114/m.26178 type:complete len:95 (-) Transcript_17114:99-383(-)